LRLVPITPEGYPGFLVKKEARDSSSEIEPSGAGRFVTTQWHMVVTAAEEGESQLLALEQLCRTYWYPLYAYIRKRGHGPEEAQDMTQEFFARLLEKNWLAEITPQGGRFRSFLLTALNRFLINQFHYHQAAKRGGGRPIISLDQEQAEQRYIREPVTHETPEKIFDRHWALTVLDRALTRLAEESRISGRSLPFERLSPFLSREPEPGEYAQAGTLLKMGTGAVGVAVHRFRQRYRELVRCEVAETLADRGDADEEMRHLFTALRDG
jgi:RNA polymerase sigma factor (sigma-70 family)